MKLEKNEQTLAMAQLLLMSTAARAIRGITSQVGQMGTHAVARILLTLPLNEDKVPREEGVKRLKETVEREAETFLDDLIQAQNEGLEETKEVTSVLDLLKGEGASA